MPKENRLSGKDNFDKVKKEGVFYQSESFALLVCKRKDANSTRIGFIISNRVSKLAVVRNKIKRILRSIIVHNLSNLRENYDLVFLAKRKIIDEEKADLEAEIVKILEKHNLLIK